MLVRLMVSWIHPQVMVFLGKVRNPTTDTMEKNLDAARALIDVLAELQTKTEGRLEAEDQRLLQHTLTELRMNWVDESARSAPEPADAAAEPAGTAAEPADAAAEPAGASASLHEADATGTPSDDADATGTPSDGEAEPAGETPEAAPKPAE